MLAPASGQLDHARGEVPVAYVVLHDEADTGARELIDHCRAVLAPFKVPRRIVFREQLPHGPTGKVLKRAIEPDTPLRAEEGSQK